MIKINTIFDYSREIPEPQFSAIYDTKAKKIDFLPLYFRATRNTISTIRKSLVKIFNTIKTGDALVADTLAHVLSLGEMKYNVPISSNIYEHRGNEFQGRIENLTETELKKILIRGLISMPNQIEPWMSIKSKSSIVYAELTDRGLLWGPHHKYPSYDTKTLTGRSRSKGFNIQGTTDQDPIRHINQDRKIFVCFDWVSADMRVAGYLSGDGFLNNSFLTSDPYTELEKLLNINDVTRNDCKLEMLKSIYSVDLSGPLLDVMPELKEWMQKKKSEYENGEALKTIMGMKIPNKDLKSSFNGIIQGSIAEAIQSVLIKIASKHNSECILTEIHDSLIVCCKEDEVSQTIKDIASLMLNPLDGINLRFPVKVSIGKRWKNWKEYKVFR